ELGPERVHPGDRLRRALIAAAALWAVGLLGTAFAPGGPSGTARWWFGGGAARAEVAQRGGEDAADRARVGDIVIRYVYPEYTGLEPREVPNSTGDVHGPPGTRVEVSLRTAELAEAAALVAYDDPPLEATVDEEGRRIRGRFTIGSDPGSWHLLI